MTSSIFSFIMAILWCDIFVVAIHFLMKKDKFVIHITIYSILCVIVVSFIRLFMGFEFGTAIVIRSYKIFPAILKFLEYTPFVGISGAGKLRVLDICVIIWIAGSIICAVKLLAGVIRFNRCMSDEPEVDDENIALIMDEVTGGRADKVRIVCTPKVSVPLISGLIRPTIYLPDIEFSDSELYYTLLHEWMHYVHKDLWVKLLAEIVCVIYWWNPVIYILKYNLDNTLEIKSDLSLSKGMPEKQKVDYLNNVLNVMNKINRQDSEYAYNHIKLGLVAVGRKKNNPIKQRFSYILQAGELEPTKKPTIVLFYIIMFVMLAVSYIFIIQSAGMPDEYNGEIEEYTDDALFDVDPDNSYLVEEPDGTYSLYIDNEYVFSLHDPNDVGISSLKIYKREELE